MGIILSYFYDRNKQRTRKYDKILLLIPIDN